MLLGDIKCRQPSFVLGADIRPFLNQPFRDPNSCAFGFGPPRRIAQVHQGSAACGVNGLYLCLVGKQERDNPLVRSITCAVKKALAIITSCLDVNMSFQQNPQYCHGVSHDYRWAEFIFSTIRVCAGATIQIAISTALRVVRHQMPVTVPQVGIDFTRYLVPVTT